MVESKLMKNMRTMKQSIQAALLGIALVCSTALAAQSNPAGPGPGQPQLTPAERAQKHTDRMKASLGLDEKQYAKVLEINKDHAQKMEAQRLEAQKERERRQAAMKEMEAAHEKRMKEILTEEQYVKFLVQKEQMKGRAKARMNENRPPHPGPGPHKGRQ